MRQLGGRSSGRRWAASCRFPKLGACIIDTSGGRPDPTSPHPAQHPHAYARHYPSIPAAPPVPGEIHRATWRRRRLTAPLRTNRPSDSERVGPAQAHGSIKRLGRGLGEGHPADNSWVDRLPRQFWGDEQVGEHREETGLTSIPQRDSKPCFQIENPEFFPYLSNTSAALVPCLCPIKPNSLPDEDDDLLHDPPAPFQGTLPRWL
jgi:hypothetical protein